MSLSREYSGSASMYGQRFSSRPLAAYCRMGSCMLLAMRSGTLPEMISVLSLVRPAL